MASGTLVPQKKEKAQNLDEIENVDLDDGFYVDLELSSSLLSKLNTLLLNESFSKL